MAATVHASDTAVLASTVSGATAIATPPNATGMSAPVKIGCFGSRSLPESPRKV